jgi:pyridoxal phosphate enzyme (YggS family)
VSSAADIAANLLGVREIIARSASRAGREPASVRLVAVSKTFPPERIVQAYDCGLRDFGENRVQEFCQKLPHLRLAEATFHMIGHLQTNKVKQAMVFDWIETLDSERLARRLQEAAAKAQKKISVLIEVKLGEEEDKTGVSEQEAAGLAAVVQSLDHLELRGLMTIPPHTPDPEGTRGYFRRLRQLRDRLQQAGFPELRELSMGMTRDFPIAIEEGATIIRLGTAIFGPRSATPAKE